MKINYDTFKQALDEASYENAFHILFYMIDNLDPDAKKADAKWTEVVRKNLDSKTIKEIEKNFKNLPREKKMEIEEKFNSI